MRDKTINCYKNSAFKFMLLSEHIVTLNLTLTVNQETLILIKLDSSISWKIILKVNRIHSSSNIQSNDHVQCSYFIVADNR